MQEQKTKPVLQALPSWLGLGFLSGLFSWPHARAGGVRFFFSPRELQRGFNKPFVERFVSLYAAWTPATYKSLGYSASDADIREHIATVQCDVTSGYLNHGDNTGVLGITHSDVHIEVAALEYMNVNEKLQIDDTTFAYELHNACVWRFAGPDVANGSRETGLVRLSGLTDEQIRANKSALDAAFFAVQSELKG